jgi:hypothetical protein
VGWFKRNGNNFSHVMLVGVDPKRAVLGALVTTTGLKPLRQTSMAFGVFHFGQGVVSLDKLMVGGSLSDLLQALDDRWQYSMCYKQLEIIAN